MTIPARTSIVIKKSIVIPFFLISINWSGSFNKFKETDFLLVDAFIRCRVAFEAALAVVVGLARPSHGLLCGCPGRETSRDVLRAVARNTVFRTLVSCPTDLNAPPAGRLSGFRSRAVAEFRAPGLAGGLNELVRGKPAPDKVKPFYAAAKNGNEYNRDYKYHNSRNNN